MTRGAVGGATAPLRSGLALGTVMRGALRAGLALGTAMRGAMAQISWRGGTARNPTMGLVHASAWPRAAAVLWAARSCRDPLGRAGLRVTECPACAPRAPGGREPAQAPVGNCPALKLGSVG